MVSASHSPAVVQAFPQAVGASQVMPQALLLVRHRGVIPRQRSQPVGKHWRPPSELVPQDVPAQQSASWVQRWRQQVGGVHSAEQVLASYVQPAAHCAQVTGTQRPACEQTVPAQQPPPSQGSPQQATGSQRAAVQAPAAG